MNWKVILLLSLFGLAMGLATITLIPSYIEPVFWVAIFIVSAYVIAKKCSANYYLHGFLTSLANCVWITSVHIIFVSTYVSHHAEEVRMMADMPLANHLRLQMLYTGTFIGIISGLILGVLALLASRMIRKIKPS